ncbi:MAG: hypothetical protein KDD36_04925 [Flavobacteriales bacterium]|nr:hypothetical protein [Flavobacteriales bacterium]
MGKLSGVVLLLSATVLMVSCKRDAVPPCPLTGAFQGKICKEFHYQSDTYVGMIQWEWDQDMVLKKTFYTDKEQPYSYSLFRGDASGYLRTESTFQESSQARMVFRQWEEDSLHRLIRFWEQKGGTSLFKEFNYDAQGRIERIEWDINAGETMYYDILHYDSNDSLYKWLRYDSGDDTFLGIWRKSYFPDQVRIDCYDAQNIFTGYELFRYDGEKLKNRFVYDADGKILEDEAFTYYPTGLLEKIILKKQREPDHTTEYSYF